MKDNTRKIIMIILIVLSILFLILGCIGFFFKGSDVTQIPSKEKNYQGSFEIVYTATRENNKVNIGINKQTNELYEEIDGIRYMFAKNNEIYTSKVPYNETPIYIFDKYKIYHEYSLINYEENNKYFYSYENEDKSDEYKSIEVICLDKENYEKCEYLKLTDNNNKEFILNMKDNNIYELDMKKYKKIIAVDNDNYYSTVKELGLFIVEGTNKKYGLIDSSGNELISPSYDKMYALDENIYIVSLNDKVGIINKNNEILLNIENYSITSGKNYILVYNYDETNNTYSLDVLNYDIKSVLKEKINDIKYLGFSGYNVYYQMYEKDNDLYLKVYENNSSSYYILHINKDGIKDKTDKAYIPLLDSNQDKFPEVKYFYEERENDDGDIKILIYDTEFKQYLVKDYKKSKNHRNIDFNYMYYNNLDIFTYKEYYFDETENKVLNYTEKFNKDKALTEEEITMQKLPNGLKFNLNEGHLKIYNNGSVILEDKQMDKYLGGYLFLRDNLIYEVIFTEIN